MGKPSVAVVSEELPLGLKLLAAGTSASFADFTTFPLDTAKVRLQVSVYYHWSLALYEL